MAQTATFRLAFRVEGNWWVAYLAKRDSMEGARKLGSILTRIVEDKERKDAFMAIMVSAMDSAVKDITGSAPLSWDTRGAPESERSGRA